MKYNVGDVIGDFIIREECGRKNNQAQYLVECCVCGLKKAISVGNIKKQNMNHTPLNCKDFYYYNLVSKTIEDYKIVSFEGGKIRAMCQKCGNVKSFQKHRLNGTCFKHSKSSCRETFDLALVGQRFGDFQIIDIDKNNMSSKETIFKAECQICGEIILKKHRELKNICTSMEKYVLRQYQRAS